MTLCPLTSSTIAALERAILTLGDSVLLADRPRDCGDFHVVLRSEPSRDVWLHVETAGPGVTVKVYEGVMLKAHLMIRVNTFEEIPLKIATVRWKLHRHLFGSE